MSGRRARGNECPGEGRAEMNVRAKGGGNECPGKGRDDQWICPWEHFSY
jgi:hypothetical protein